MELTPKEQKNLERLAKIVDSGNLGVFEHLVELENKIDAEIPSIKDIISRVKGEKGNSPTKEELVSIIKPLLPVAIKGDKGNPGKDYVLTQKDKKEIASKIDVPIVTKVVEKTEVIKEVPIVTQVVNNVENEETGQDIIEKINDDDTTLIKKEKVEGLIALEKKVDTTFKGRNVYGNRGLLEVTHDDTLSGTGTVSDPLSVIGGGGTGTYTPQGVTTATVGGIASGTDLGTSPVTIQSILDAELYPYIAPAFTAFSISGQATTVEVGTVISGTKSFVWSFSNSANITASTMDIIDVTGGTNLATNISNTSPYSVSVGSVTLAAPGTYSWRGSATNTHSTTFNSSNFTVSWKWKVYNGVSALTTLSASDIQALTTGALASGFAGTYNFAATNYKYFAWPDSFGSPTAGTGFKDTATNLSVSMATSADNAFYSNVQNGWYYGTIVVTNTEGVTTTYRVYRSKNLLASTLQVLVS